MSRFRSGVLLIAAVALAALVTRVAVPSVAQSLPSAIKRVVMIGPNSTRSLSVRGTVTLRPSVLPTSDVKSVVFYLDGNGLGTVNEAPFKLEWDSTTKEDGEYLLKAIGSTEAGQEVWSGEGRIVIANKTPLPSPPTVASPPTMTPTLRPPAATTAPVLRPPSPTMTPAARPPATASVSVKPTTTPKPVLTAKPPIPAPKPMVVAQSPNTATTKPSVVAPKPTVKPVPKPVMPPATVAKPKPVAPSATAAKPKPVAPSATVAKPRPVAPPKTVARPKPVAPKVIVSPAAWKTYTNGAYGFVAGYPGTAKVRNESSHMKPKGPGSFWIAFTQTSSGKPWYAINVRHMKTNDPGSPDKFAKYNQYLLSWDRTNVAGLDGFKTVSGRASSKRVIHRTLLVDDRDVWMLNLTDVSGNDPIITGEIFKRFVDSFRPEGSVGGGHPVPVTPVRPAPMLRTGHPTPPPPAMAPAPVPAPEPAPEAPPPPSPDDGGYDSGE